MEEILHQLMCSLSHFLHGFSTSQVVHDFFHQQEYNESQPVTGQVSERVTTESIEGPFQLNPGEEVHFGGDLGYREDVPGNRKRIHIPPWEKEYHLQKYLGNRIC